ncbi:MULTISPECIES: chorismate mutase [unclassified Acinetobacter]|uniref:chorismate mutase n=1 Tax=unclassified Acinetobacter TaxID=196816 RepID=UPI0029346A36|nr:MULTISPECIES: chorismate mutase [unclassified Acinetobacter]WOE30870.1 chorismate mutase [Acinetobacter sp. SAAs470]WOE39065.1 chorismate mutase [Acinetobacter sp. SAAs474]
MNKEKVQSLAQARSKIDEIDSHIIELIATRQFYVDQVIRFKRSMENVPSPRIDEVLNHVKTQAQEQGLDPDLIAQLYQEMIQHFIRRELKEIRP